MKSTKDAFPPLLIAAADFGVGGLLYQQVSVVLGVLLFVCGMSVLITVASGSLSLAGSVLWRNLPEKATE